MIAQLWTKSDCDVCTKAACILAEAGMVLEVSEQLDPAAMADFAYHDKDVAVLPLIRVVGDAGVAVAWWNGDDVKAGLLPLVRKLQRGREAPEEAK